MILIKDKSQVKKETSGLISSIFKFLTLVFSITVTLLLFKIFQSNKPLPTSTQKICFAFFFNKTSVKPPVES